PPNPILRNHCEGVEMTAMEDSNRPSGTTRGGLPFVQWSGSQASNTSTAPDKILQVRAAPPGIDPWGAVIGDTYLSLRVASRTTRHWGGSRLGAWGSHTSVTATLRRTATSPKCLPSQA